MAPGLPDLASPQRLTTIAQPNLPRPPVPGLFFQGCGPIERNAAMAGQSGPTRGNLDGSLALIFYKPEEA
jgi:hypothetical protein